VVGDHLVLADPLPEIMSHALGEPAGVGKDENGPVLRGKSLEPVVDLSPHLVGGDGGQLLVRRLDGNFPRADVPDRHDGARRLAALGAA